MELTPKCRSVANYIIEEINKFNDGKSLREKILLHTKRLQKLIYFCEVEYMKRNDGKTLFEDEYYLWSSGPVIPEIYSVFMMYQDGDLKPRYDKKEERLSEDIKLLIVEILEVTRDLDTRDLIIMSSFYYTHFNKKYMKDGVKILKKDIYKYYFHKNIIEQLKNKEFIFEELSSKCLIRKK